jgi:predicted site-specific integrase-resolvase
MATLEKKTKEQIQELMNELTRVRDEARVRLHLAGMELKQRYDKLEEEVFEAEQRAKRASEDTASDLIAKLRELRARFEGLREHQARI